MLFAHHAPRSLVSRKSSIRSPFAYRGEPSTTYDIVPTVPPSSVTSKASPSRSAPRIDSSTRIEVTVSIQRPIVHCECESPATATTTAFEARTSVRSSGTMNEAAWRDEVTRSARRENRFMAWE